MLEITNDYLTSSKILFYIFIKYVVKKTHVPTHKIFYILTSEITFAKTLFFKYLPFSIFVLQLNDQRH